MKNYTKPEIEITVLNSEEVLMASGGLNTNSANFTKSENNKGYNIVEF